MGYTLQLTFGNDVADGIAGVAPNAGPPQKILHYLKVLALLVDQRKDGGLGDTMIQWLNSTALPRAASPKPSRTTATKCAGGHGTMGGLAGIHEAPHGLRGSPAPLAAARNNATFWHVKEPCGKRGHLAASGPYLLPCRSYVPSAGGIGRTLPAATSKRADESHR